MTPDVHTVIVGAGVIGASVAYAMRDQDEQVFLLEREDRPGLGISSRNSGVIHAGLYYPRGSLKSRMCRAGNPALARFAQAHGVGVARCGKFLVANSAEEIEHLKWLQHNAGPDLVRQADHLPPGIRAKMALFSPTTGIVDTHALVDALIQASCVDVLYHQQVTSIEPQGDLVVMVVNGETVRVGQVINCTGLHATDFCPPRRHFLAKGSYFQVRHPVLKNLEALIYPAIPKESPSLGIHLTRNIWGEWYLGPDFEWVDSIDHSVSESRRDAFLAAACQYLPELNADHLQPAYSGIRPKLSRTSTSDFTFERQGARGQIIHCLGIESPGLTACLAIGKHVRDLLRETSR